jgi:hypothetical protein
MIVFNTQKLLTAGQVYIEDTRQLIKFRPHEAAR